MSLYLLNGYQVLRKKKNYIYNCLGNLALPSSSFTYSIYNYNGIRFNFIDWHLFAIFIERLYSDFVFRMLKINSRFNYSFFEETLLILRLHHAQAPFLPGYSLNFVEIEKSFCSNKCSLTQKFLLMSVN